MKSEFRQRSAVVTGAAGNLGRAVVRRFLEAGAAVAIVDPHPLGLELAALAPDFERVLAIQTRIDDEVAAAGVARAVLDRFGRIDALVHLVGGWSGLPVLDTTIDDWQRQFALNLVPAFLMIRAVLPDMIARGSGRIVCVGSRTVFRPVANQAAYTAAKAGLIGFVQSVAVEVKSSGVTANCVVPSVIDTPQNRAAMPKADPSRWVSPGRLADTIYFLCSDAAGDISGAAVPVYGRD